MTELLHASDDTAGNLDDVPMHWRNDVVKTIENVEQCWSRGLVGGITELRGWITQMQRLSGFSREVCKQLYLAMSRCLALDREGSPSRVDIQQAFVRMGGVQHTCNMMMLRLSDEVIVAHVLNVLTAALQNSPLVAESFQLQEPHHLKLVLRTIERHRASWEVAEAGCKLIGHMCSHTAVDQGDNRPIRAKSHRECQNVLAREGAMDIVVEIIELYSKEVKALANRAEVMKQSKLREAAAASTRVVSEEISLGKPQLTTKKVPTTLGLKDRIAKVQANLELRNAWQRVIDKELITGKVQEAALQALNLLIEGNTDTTRQLAGTLWVQHMNVVLSVGESFMAKAEKLADAKYHKQKKKVDSDSEDESVGGLSPTAGRPREMGRKVQVPEGEARKAMTSLESLSHKLHIAVDVLRGHTSRDRPSLAVKACVFALQLLKHHKTQVEKVNHNAEWMRRGAAIGRSDPARDDDRRAHAPFGVILTTVQAIISTIRTHIENASVLTAAMSLLAELRSNALLSVPAGTQVEGSSAVKAFQALLVEAGGKDTEWLMRQAARLLVKAAKNTEPGDHRIVEFGVKPPDLEGNGHWLTPRMRRAADQARLLAELLAGDALGGSWGEYGEPGRWKKVLTRRDGLAAIAQLKEDERQAAAMGIGLEQYRAQTALKEFVQAYDDASTSSGSGSYLQPDEEVEEEDLMGEQEWARAVGFGVHDQVDFDRMWRKPITDAIRRCLPEQAPKGSIWAQEAEAKKKKLAADAVVLGVSLDDSLDELLVVEMLESEQGKLRVQATVRPQDKLQSNVIEMRAAELSKPESAAKSITCELSKNLSKSGNLLPKYGLRVKFRAKSASSPSLASLKKRMDDLA
eukprot:TRINITY_DN56926_c0_g1_i1.p1 TRINITY_DN56926_c0_g1~~TRINITY_DN56926_c0_g1_i1.p1  ORF type:complete len:859 (-),score=165.05 TRINITY_DN56926_c0_g1_i1:390-2966(-)